MGRKGDAETNITTATRTRSLRVGDKDVAVGDHVYVSPPYSSRDGEPYLIARIIELPEPAEGEQARARVAYYFRMRDITSRWLSDFRTLLSHKKKPTTKAHKSLTFFFSLFFW
jgi:hypothetical protein